MKCNISTHTHEMAIQHKKLTSKCMQLFIHKKIPRITYFQEFWNLYLGFSNVEEFWNAFDGLPLKPTQKSKFKRELANTPQLKDYIPRVVGNEVDEMVKDQVSMEDKDDDNRNVIETQDVSDINPTVPEEKLESQIANIDARIQEENFGISLVEEDIAMCESIISSIVKEAMEIRARLECLTQRNQDAEASIESLKAKKCEHHKTLESLLFERETLIEQLQKFVLVKILFSLEREETLANEEFVDVLLADDIEKQYGIREEDRYQQIPAIVSADGTILQKPTVLKKIANVLCLKQILNNKKIILILENMDEYLVDLFCKLGIECDVM